jgi:purine nucleosidase
MESIILDTDIATDVDDAMALALAIRSPEIDLKGVTTVYGDVKLRARLAKKLLQLGGKEDIPVYAGIEQPLLRNREVWWPGHEGKGVLEDEGEAIRVEEQHAVDFIIETVMANSGQITLVPIGPLTNIAAALIREPLLAQHVKQIILMGGVTRLGDNGDELSPVEHNIKCDPEAASVVFSSKAPIIMVGLDVTMKVSIHRAEQQQLIHSGDPLNFTLGTLIGQWLDVIQQDWTTMHDPLTVSLLIDRSLVSTKRMKVTVDYDHRHPTGTTVAVRDDAGNVEVGLGVDSKRFLAILMARLTNN